MNDHDEPRKNGKHNVILLGLAVHVLLLCAIFDVYFSSPLDNGMQTFKATKEPPAKRLVLFVADGLRSEAVLGYEERLPFLTSVMKGKGSWGVAHTRVPTESRPGHVAMLAGIYEDPSAIFKGWKSNPVNFDSVINQSTNAWCWGSPDIVNMFNRDNLPKIRVHSYDAGYEDFGKTHTEELDRWVFEKVAEFLRNEVSKCSRNCERYYESGNVFFLHLLGIDTAGHGFKPKSKRYIQNIKYADEYVNKTYLHFEKVFKDNKTVYVFTSDHGMTDWGSHGSGSHHETETPFVAWGAGIKRNPARQDFNQTDIAPLLSTLVGINIPINSLGILPFNCLDVNNDTLMEMMLMNTVQIAEIFNVKRRRTEQNALVYLPYEGVTDLMLSKWYYRLETLRKLGDVEQYTKECTELMLFLKRGVDYYHNYYQYPVLVSVTIGFSFWIVHLAVIVLEYNYDTPRLTSGDGTAKILLLLCYIVTVLLCVKSRFPFTYYLYFNFPIFMFSVIRKKLVLLRTHFNDFCNNLGTNVLNLVFYLAGLRLLVYGFYHRLGFSILMVLISVWIVASKSLRENTNRVEKIAWTVCCLILSLFPALPVMKTKFSLVAYSTGYAAWMIAFMQLYQMNKVFFRKVDKFKTNQRCLLVQFVCLAIAGIYVWMIEEEFIPPDSSVKYISWPIMAVPIIAIPFSSDLIPIRLMATFFGFAPFYLLVSSNIEALFSLFYVALLCVWLLVETKCFLRSKSYTIIYYHKFQEYSSVKNLDADVFRRAFLFMAFIFLGFFGTGNVASLNSFDPMWVRAFLTVFSPFKMAGLIVFKLTVPFIFTCCVFKAINAVGRENVLSIFCIVLMFSDLMVMQFMYLITNVGSWLDIGTSLSHFIIMEAFVTILLLLYGVAHWLMLIKYSL